jgi:hypothetical protein
MAALRSVAEALSESYSALASSALSLAASTSRPEPAGERYPARLVGLEMVGVEDQAPMVCGVRRLTPGGGGTRGLTSHQA